MGVRRLDAAGYYMSTSSSMIKNHADAVHGMVTAMAQATKFVQTNPDEAKTIVEKVTIPYSTFVDADFAQTAYQKVGLTLPG
jgi:ABC-type nitrate/sulfonate/bicarbonate transport system substrate-binding protein